MSTAVSNQREYWIDHAKAIALILVILGHVSSGLNGWFNFKFVYGIHLVVFFVLSGYTVKAKPIDQIYLRSKFQRLFTPYFITCFIIMLVDMFNSFFLDGERSIEQITSVIANTFIKAFFASGTISNFGEIELCGRIGALWFFPALFFSLIIFQFLVNRIKNPYLLAGVSVIVSLVGYLTGLFIWLPFSVQSGMFAVFYLWVGYMLKQYDLLRKLKWYAYLIALVILTVGIRFGYCAVSFATARVKDLLISTTVGLAGCLVVFFMARLSKKITLLSWIGQNTITILCIHIVSLEHLWRYYSKILYLLGILDTQAGVWVRICMEVVCVIFATWLLELVKKKLYRQLKETYIQKKEKAVITRDPAVDVAKGILIISMLIGHYNIDETLWTIIYSCHMIAFVFLSGYCYKKTQSIGKGILHMARTFLLPYLICCIVNILLDFRLWSGTYFLGILKTYVIGMSLSGRLLGNIESVGPVYFILMLFIVRLIYMCIDHIFHKNSFRWIAVLICTALGIVLGKLSLWLPWSIDVALYSLLYYQIGVTMKQKDLLTLIQRTPWFYFGLSSVWAYMIYMAGMDIVYRRYGIYGLVILGSMAGTILVYCISAYLSRATVFVSKMIATIGQASLIILIIYRLLNYRLKDLLGMVMDQDGFALMVVNILIQIILSVLIAAGINIIKIIRNKKVYGV